MINWKRLIILVGLTMMLGLVLVVPKVCPGVRVTDIKCKQNILTIKMECEKYFRINSRYPQTIKEISLPLTNLRCPNSKNQTTTIDYDIMRYYDNVRGWLVIIYEKASHHYIGWRAFGLMPYNARHILIMDDKNESIELYSDNDFKSLLEKYQENHDKQNRSDNPK